MPSLRHLTWSDRTSATFTMPIAAYWEAPARSDPAHTDGRDWAEPAAGRRPAFRGHYTMKRNDVVLGRERVASALLRLAEFTPVWSPPRRWSAARIDPGDEFDTAITFVVEDDRITRMCAMRSPHN